CATPGADPAACAATARAARHSLHLRPSRSHRGARPPPLHRDSSTFGQRDHAHSPSAYIASISRSYIWAMTLRLIFIVGVSSPAAIPNGRDRIENFLICSTRASSLLVSSICCWIAAWICGAVVSLAVSASGASFLAASSSIVTSATRYF